jgi:hypothetical protein
VLAALREFAQVAPPKLAVDSELKQRELALTSSKLQSYANCPNFLQLEGCLPAKELPHVPRLSNFCRAGFHDTLLLHDGAVSWSRTGPKRTSVDRLKPMIVCSLQLVRMPTRLIRADLPECEKRQCSAVVCTFEVPVDVNGKLVSRRFNHNLARVSGIVSVVVFSDSARLGAIGFCQRTGPSADILRACVVYLHAAFEDMLREYANPRKGPINLYSRADIEKVLRYRGISSKPFMWLFPALTQMAKRRKRLVHDADLPSRKYTAVPDWSIADEWQLILWTIAVPAFFALLQVHLRSDDEQHRSTYERLKAGIEEVYRLGKALVDLTKHASGDIPALQAGAQTALDAAKRVLSVLTFQGQGDPRAQGSN